MTEWYDIRQPINYSRKRWMYIHPVQLFAKSLVNLIQKVFDIFDWLCLNYLYTSLYMLMMTLTPPPPSLSLSQIHFLNIFQNKHSLSQNQTYQISYENQQIKRKRKNISIESRNQIVTGAFYDNCCTIDEWCRQAARVWAVQQYYGGDKGDWWWWFVNMEVVGICLKLLMVWVWIK